MLFGDILNEECIAARKEGHESGLAEGRKAGLAEGQGKLLHLITLMTDAGEYDQIQRLTQDPEFLQDMYIKYQVNS